ncbi:uncharacterized protein LOC134178173 isoform X2 [Corticium candelabrum]|uniref:uncharacterized protein LOC134178173 isoform X2 n=1 Tax=Corticium candelabrum TaxID=121492 RepID=UPI002E262AC1|nr:uncharacterized protein LOC134178173 isoform X2 [Corticium candelabrum]
MASELSLQAVRELLLDKGGIVRNKDLVRYFKEFLNNPATKAQAREKFKEFVNTLCSISSNEQNDKLLVLKAQYLVTDHLPYSATSSQLKSVATPKFELGSPGQDACAQAIASARAIQEGFSLAGPSPIKPKRSAPKPPSHPRVLLGEFGVVTDESEVTRQGMSGENGSKVDGTFDDVSHSPIGTSSEALPDVLVTASSPPPVPLSHSEGGDESPSLLTQIDSMLDDKFPALQRGRPSKLIKERAEAMARSSAASPIEQHNLSQVMMSVAAKAAALAEKRDDSDEEEEVKKAPLQPHAPSTKDRMAATVLNLAEPMVSMTLPSADVTDGATHSVARKTETSSNSERMKALLDSFQHSATLQDTVKQGMSPNRPRSRTVDSCSSPGTSQRWAAMTNSPPVSGQLSPFFARNVPQGPRASLQTRIRKKEKETKDGAGNKQEAPKKHERKEPTKPGMNGGSDGEDSGDEDDDQGFDSSHVVLDPIEREWLPCSASGVTRRVEQMLQRDASLANKKDFINGVSNLLYVVVFHCF